MNRLGINRFNALFISFVFLVLFSSCHKKTTLYSNLNSKDSGIDFANVLSSTPDLNILNYLYFYNGAGVAAADFNNDGYVDLYFTGNEIADRLYLNKGELHFEDITEKAGINNEKPWTTGVTTVDINADGWMDIYICKVGSYNKISGENLLYVNQGIKDGIPVFSEQAAEYGLNFKGFSTQAGFLDYDLDGDLDMFLLNHSVHPNRTYGKGSKRMESDSLSGDKLYENINGKYKDVTSGSGIYQSKIGYGLGISISDINDDGYPDIYIGNDFFENDYLYINQKDKTFKEIISQDITRLGHTTHFSMGNAIHDFNNDRKMDILSLDMLPEDLYTYKTSGVEYPYQTYEYYLKNGYAPQYMHNNFHLNFDNDSFHEIGFLSGISATEWSWNPLVADFDNDGFKDIYITNGILGATNDMDFINFISNERIQERINRGMSQEDLSLIEELPQKKTVNYFFKNNGDNTYQDVTLQWSSAEPSFSNGAVSADLDNDGDLDIVVNNVNEKAYVLRNNLNSGPTSTNYLKLSFDGDNLNSYGIGAKIHVYATEGYQTYENMVTKGYLSALPPRLHIGLGKNKFIDSLEVIWPDASYQVLKDIDINRCLILKENEASGNYYQDRKTQKKKYLTNVKSPITYKHNDFISVEFSRDPLVPYASTNLGPSIAIADINNDNLEDILIGGAKMQPAQLFLQLDGGDFRNHQYEVFEKDKVCEDIDQVFFDADNDGDQDLIVVSGGNEFRNGKPLQPRLYFNINGTFVKDSMQFANIEINASRIKAIDIDNDKDLDICITSNLVPWEFGMTPEQFIFENRGKGQFEDITHNFAPEFKTVGNVQDMVWIDINEDSFKDVIVVGHWMPVTIFLNNGKRLRKIENNGLQGTHGWWNAVSAADFDNDGDIDLVIGNWGLNTRLRASLEEPITLYRNDFDNNSSVEPVVTYYYKGMETCFSSKDELVKQMPFLNKKYLSYANFANATIEEIFSKERLNEAYKKEAYELASCYFENRGNNTFTKHQLPLMSQISQVNALAIDDFNNDGLFDVLLAGNNHQISTQLGRLDASHGTLLFNDGKGFFNYVDEQNFDISGVARDIEKIKINESYYYVISINNGEPVILKKEKNEQVKDL